jgi:DNA primase
LPATERYSRTQFAPISNQEMRVPSGALSDDFKELVRTRTDIVQLVGERVALQSRRGGRELVGLCPFHDDHAPSLLVNPERQSYKCWACGEGGDCFAFVQKIENVGFRDALELLATRANLELPRYGKGDGKNTDGKPTRKEQIDALAWAEGEYHTCLRTSNEGDAARKYLESRGFTRETIERFRLGYAPADGQFLQKRAAARFKSSQAITAQLATVRLIAARAEGGGYYDYFRGRVMFPIRNPTGHTVAFGGRVLPGAATNMGKYVNSAESVLFSKNRVVFALDVARSAIVERDAAVVMEGYADCIMAHQFGITNAVATLGTALTENHVSTLKRFTRKVVLVFDGDKAGKDAAEKSLPRFLSQEVDLRILTLTSEKDPADFLIAQGAEPFQKLLETAVEAWEYKLRLLIERNGLDSVDAREQVVTEMLELFRLAPGFGGSARENIVLNRLAFRVGLSESQIREMFVTSRRKANQAAASNGRSRVVAARIENNDNTAGDNTAGENAGANANSHQTKLEGELLEIVFIDPTAVDVLRTEVAVDDFQHEHYRRLLAICYRLSEEGKQPSYDNVMSAVEDPILIRLVVTLERSAQSKAPKLRLDCAVDEPGSRHALLVKLIGLLKRRADARDASLDRMAIQSGLAGGNPAQATPAGTLDAAQREMLRRATGIHSQRAGGRAAGAP